MITGEFVQSGIAQYGIKETEIDFLEAGDKPHHIMMLNVPQRCADSTSGQQAAVA